MIYFHCITIHPLFLSSLVPFSEELSWQISAVMWEDYSFYANPAPTHLDKYRAIRQLCMFLARRTAAKLRRVLIRLWLPQPSFFVSFSRMRNLYLTAFIPILFLRLYVSNVLGLPTHPSHAGVDAGGQDCSNDNWILSLTKFNQTRFTAQPYVANGYIGARLPAAGVGFQSFSPQEDDPKALGQGWPIFGPRVTASTVAGFYDVQNDTLGTNFEQKGGEQVMSLLPSWPSLFLTIRQKDSDKEATYGPGVEASEIEKWNQSLSIRNGVVKTDIYWKPKELELLDPVHLQYTVIAHRKVPTLGLMRLEVHGISNKFETIITDVLDGQGAARTQNPKVEKVKDLKHTIYSSVHPHGLQDVEAHLFSSLHLIHSTKQRNTSLPKTLTKLIGSDNPATMWQSYLLDSHIPQKSGSSGSLSAWKAVGVASTDAYPNAMKVARKTILSASNSGWDAVLKDHIEAWEEIWENGGDIIIHGSCSEDQGDGMLARLQTQARASLFHLLSNVRQGSEQSGLGDNSIAPSGLTSDSYA